MSLASGSPLSARQDRARRRAIRSGYRHRAGRRSHGDLAYAVYSGVLVTAAIVFPFGRAVIVGLGDAVGADLASQQTREVIAITLGWLLGLTAWIGRLTGPVILSPFFVVLLAAGPLRRSRALRRPLLASTGLLLVALTGGTGLVAGAAIRAGVAGAVDLLWWCAAGAGYALLLSIVWLAARVLPTPLSAPLGPVLVGATVLTTITPALLPATPWGLTAAAWLATPDPLGAILLVGVLAAWILGAPALLARMPLAKLATDADQMTRLRSVVLTVDLASSLSGWRARPYTGRRLRAVRGDRQRIGASAGAAGSARSAPAGSARSVARLARVVLRRDLIAALRTPDRAVVGLLTLTVAAALAAAAPTAELSWVIGGAAAGLGYAALGVFCDGFRHAAAARGVPSLYGVADRRLTTLHAGLPAAAGAVAIALGVPVAIGLAGAAADPFEASTVIAPVAMVAVVLLARLYDARKGPIPLELMNPVPTPGGDASGFIVALWQVDALIGSVIAGALILTWLP